MNKRFHFRGFTSFAIAMSFLVLTTSGVVLYMSPRGRVANWTGWGFLGIDKESWGGLHIVAALLFIALAVLHFVFNWKPFLGYLRNRASSGIKLRNELAAAVVLSIVVIVGTLADVPPFSAVPTLAERIKDYWETTEAPAPYAHAELSTVAEFAEKTGTTVEDVTQKLTASGFAVTDPGQRIADIAAENESTPSALFAKTGHQSGQGAGSGASFGMGRKTLREVCVDASVPLDTAIASLRTAGIEATGDENMRAVAERSGKNPHDLLTIIKPETE